MQSGCFQLSVNVVCVLAWAQAQHTIEGQTWLVNWWDMTKFICESKEPSGCYLVLSREYSVHKDTDLRPKPFLTGGIVDSEKYIVMFPDPAPWGTHD